MDALASHARGQAIGIAITAMARCDRTPITAMATDPLPIMGIGASNTAADASSHRDQ